MGARAQLLSLVVVAAAVVGYAAYDLRSVERYLPAALPYAKSVRDAVPPNILAALPPPPDIEKLLGSAAPPPAAAPPPRPPISIQVGRAEKKDMPWLVDEIGSARSIATVALRPHFDAAVEKVLISDGAAVKAGDVLFKLESHDREAQLQGSQAQLAKDEAQLEQAERDVRRYTDLVGRNATPVLNLDNAKTSVATNKAAIALDRANLENLMIQLTWFTIKAPISGRVGVVNIKAGNVAKAGDNSANGVLATINQIKPIYASFSVPQSLLPTLREAMAAGAKVEATPQGGKKAAVGKLALLDNSVDVTTGTIVAQAIFDNDDEILWPGQLCNLRVNLRNEPNTVVIPREAVQIGQKGNFVFVVENNIVHVRNVEVGRTQDGETVVKSGLNGDETVVVDGALLLIEGSKVEPRAPSKVAG